MSLINDALKRASQATTPPPASAAPSSQGLRPVEYKKRAPAWPLFLIPALVVVSLGVGVWIFFRASHFPAELSQESVLARQSATPLAAETPAPSHASEAAPVKTLAQPAVPQPAPAPQPPATSTAVATVAPPEQTAAALPASLPAPVPAPPPAPAYKLQGIFYRPARPMALINGLNVLSGDKVGDAQVVSIQPDRVTLSVDGQTKVLTLSQKP